MYVCEAQMKVDKLNTDGGLRDLTTMKSCVSCVTASNKECVLPHVLHQLHFYIQHVCVCARAAVQRYLLYRREKKNYIAK